MIDDDVREKLAFLQAQHGDLERQLLALEQQIIDLVWPLLKTKADCREAGEVLAGNGKILYFIQARESSLSH